MDNETCLMECARRKMVVVTCLRNCVTSTFYFATWSSVFKNIQQDLLVRGDFLGFSP
jgi:hypothetical protein